MKETCLVKSNITAKFVHRQWKAMLSPLLKKQSFPLWITPTFLQENLDPSFYDFSNISDPYK